MHNFTPFNVLQFHTFLHTFINIYDYSLTENLHPGFNFFKTIYKSNKITCKCKNLPSQTKIHKLYGFW